MSANPQLDLAFDFLESTGVNIFLTGRAGTGKTTFLHNLRLHTPKRMIVVAPTGVAAINAKGMTIHSFFQLPFGLYVPDTTRVSSNEIRKFSKTKIKIMRSMEMLVIDEISMVRADLLDAIDDVLRRFRDKTKPFGGVQLLMIGDLQQLSPVVKNDEWEILKEYYNTPYFFDSKALTKSSYRVIELKHIYRQTDSKFIELLAKVRDGLMDEATLTAINSRHIHGFNPPKSEGYITLTSHNNTAKTINNSKLSELKEDEYTFTALVKGNFDEYMYPIDFQLVLKKGAQVMFTKNDSSPQKRYVNGSIGEITAISESEIEVQLADNNEIIDVECADWENTKYTIDKDTKEITETVEGVFTQYPLKTAWAITIHKSQGLTFDKVIIDAANSFSHGQVYVALSRCRTLEGVVLGTPLRYGSIINDQTIREFTKEVEQNPLSPEQLIEDKRCYYRNILIELFDFGQIIAQIRFIRRQLEENLATTYPKLLAKWNSSIELIVNDIDGVSIKFKNQIDRLMFNPDYLNDSHLKERIEKGAIYFLEKFESLVAPLLSSMDIEIDNKEVRKTIMEGLKRFKESRDIKVATLESVKEGFSVKEYLTAKAKIVAAEEEKPKKEFITKQSEYKEAKIEVDESDFNDIVDGELFNKLRVWRKEVADEIGKAAFVVAHQKVLIAIAAIAPTSMRELSRIKGVGKAFLEKYGSTVLGIISEHHSQN